MAKKDPEKVLKDLKSYRIDGDRQRVLDEIDSFMDVESVDDNHATVKHAWLGFVMDDKGIDRLTCELATWDMPFAESHIPTGKDRFHGPPLKTGYSLLHV